MDQRTRKEVYGDFLEFVRSDLEGHRRTFSRRMFHVFIWCLIAPASISVILLLGVRFGLLPRSVTRYMDWIVLVFPILYSLYFLGREVLGGMLSVVRRGGTSATLAQAQTEFAWREKTVAAMRSAVRTPPDSWAWIASHFAIDLKEMKHRTGHLTALAGAIFFLLMQGIDVLGDKDPMPETPAMMIQGFFEASSNNISQFVGLGLFLVLFYLSGNQTHHSLQRYLDCTQILIQEAEEK